MGKVVYLGYYSMPAHKRICSPAAVTMMDYVCTALRQTGLAVTLLSPSQAEANAATPREEVALDDRSKVVFLPSYPRVSSKNLPGRLFLRLRRKRDLRRELSALTAEDTLIVYHSMIYADTIRKIQKKQHFRLILQVCEIYSDVAPNISKEKELHWIDCADGYIFSTRMLAERYNPHGKPYTVCLGTYLPEPKRERLFNDDFTHIVYAGTFDPRKGGAAAAAAAAKFLPFGYHIHIIGFGSHSEISQIVNLVDSLSKTCTCRISYDGCLSGEEYIRFLQSCDIGLSTQNPDAAFNGSSFPSKILSYLANGLRVVSIRIPAIETSAVGESMYYYEKQTPEEIASAILKIPRNDPYDSRALLCRLDADFQENMHTLLTTFDKR